MSLDEIGMEGWKLPRPPRSRRWTKTARRYWAARFSQCLAGEFEFLGPGTGFVLDREETEARLDLVIAALFVWAGTEER